LQVISHADDKVMVGELWRSDQQLGILGIRTVQFHQKKSIQQNIQSTSHCGAVHRAGAQPCYQPEERTHQKSFQNSSTIEWHKQFISILGVKTSFCASQGNLPFQCEQSRMMPGRNRQVDWLLSAA
jgi:hypothetical protein